MPLATVCGPGPGPPLPARGGVQRTVCGPPPRSRLPPGWALVPASVIPDPPPPIPVCGCGVLRGEAQLLQHMAMQQQLLSHQQYLVQQHGMNPTHALAVAQQHVHAAQQQQQAQQAMGFPGEGAL